MKILFIFFILSGVCTAASITDQNEAVLKFKKQSTPAEQKNVLEAFTKANPDVAMTLMFAESKDLKKAFPQRQKRAAPEDDLNKVKDRLENVYVVKIPAGESPESFCQKLLVDPQIKYCQPNTRMVVQNSAP